MIFVTVGTHEQQFNRLIRCVDELKRDGLLEEEVIMQIGYSTYIPKHCAWKRIYPYEEMSQLIDQAKIVITHGGPSSFMAVLQAGKIPIVVPRQKKYGEHVNNHQVEFCTAVFERYRNIIVIHNTDRIAGMIREYESMIRKMTSGMNPHNESFIKSIISEVEAII